MTGIFKIQGLNAVRTSLFIFSQGVLSNAPSTSRNVLRADQLVSKAVFRPLTKSWRAVSTDLPTGRCVVLNLTLYCVGCPPKGIRLASLYRFKSQQDLSLACVSRPLAL